MSWEKVKISEVYEGLYDGPHATPPDSEDGAVFLGISNITKNGHIDFSNIKHINEKDLPKWTKRVTPQAGDIVFSYEATLNLYAIIPEGFWGCLGRRMALIRPDETKALGKFLYYYFFSEEWRATVAENTITGATVDRIPIARFPEFPISLPPIEIQKRIADILTSYDDLIENNQKQIKLLEEMAQRIYKEWFIDLRFPGYENVTVVDGVPEGWIAGCLGDIAIDTGKREKKDNRDQYSYYLPIDCLPKKSLAYSEVNDISLAESSLIAFSETDIVFGAMRPYFHKVVVARDNGLTRSTCFVLNAKESQYWAYLLMLMFSEDTVNYATKISVGTTMPYARWKDMVNMPVVIPSIELAENFKEIVVPLIEKINILTEQIISLVEARDRILPKLMNGEIEI